MFSKIYNILLILGSMLFPVALSAQDSFQVIETLGSLHLAEAQEADPMPSRLREDDRIVFKDTSAKIFMLREKEWYIAHPKSLEDLNKPKFIWECLNKLEGWAQSRCMICEPYSLHTLQDEILEAKGKCLILGDQMKLRLDPRHVHLDEHNFVAIRFEHQKEPISRTLSYENDQIIISKDLLYSKEHQAIPHADTMLVAFFYVEHFDKTHFEEKKITEFAETRLVFLEEEKARNILHKIKKIIPELPPDSWEMAKLLQLYLYERYQGYILLEILKEWL